MSSIVHHFNSIGWIWNWSSSPESLNSDWNWRYSVLCYLEIRWMTLENNRAHLLYYIKLCASFQIHLWNKGGVTVRKLLIWVNIDFLSCVTLKFNGWHWKTKGHLFYTTLSFVHHFKAMAEFKLELQFGNAQFGSKSAFFVSCDLEIWQMTMKNYRAPLLCCFRLCASFHSHWGIKTGVTVWKHPIWVKINNTFYQVTLKFDGWPWEMIEHLF